MLALPDGQLLLNFETRMCSDAAFCFLISRDFFYEGEEVKALMLT